MTSRSRWILAVCAFAAATSVTVGAGQNTSLQKPPRISAGALVKPKVTPGRFRNAELPLTLSPEKPICESAALYGQAQFDLSESRIRVFGNDSGNHVGIKVLLASTNRPVTFEFEIVGQGAGEHQIMLQVFETVRKPGGTTESKPLNTTTVSVRNLRQKLTITASPTGEGWVSAYAGPSTTGTAFELASITVRKG